MQPTIRARLVCPSTGDYFSSHAQGGWWIIFGTLAYFWFMIHKVAEILLGLFLFLVSHESQTPISGIARKSPRKIPRVWLITIFFNSMVVFLFTRTNALNVFLVRFWQIKQYHRCINIKTVFIYLKNTLLKLNTFT